MNKPYLIAIDLDGTLLTNRRKISLANKRYLRKLEKEGNIVVLASGRPSRALLYFQKEIGLHSPLICYNGAYCFHPYDSNFKKTAYNFPLDIVKQIYKEIGPDIYSNIMCETDDEIWLLKEDEGLNSFFWHENMDIHYGDLDKTLNQDPWTMIIQLKNRDNDEKIIKAVTRHEGFSLRFWWNSPYAEIFHLNTSKASCIERIREYYDIPKENVIAIGDADNDIEMIQSAGFGIAMINGTEKVKALANLISKKDNNHSGVSKALKAAFKILKTPR